MNALTDSKFHARPKALEGLPAFPAVARKLMEQVSKEDCSIAEVSKLIRTDAAFAAEVLKLANSAMFGLRYEVVSILHAISVLGMDRLKALVLTVGLRDLLAGARQMELVHRCWRHNLSTALTAEFLAEFCWLDKAVAYTAGLLHEIGRLALIMLHREKYQELVHLTESSGRELRECERTAFGIDSQQAGAWIAEDWGLPKELREVAACRDQPRSGGQMTLGRLIWLSCRISNEVGFVAIGKAGTHWDPSALQQFVPADLWPKMEPRMGELMEMVQFKINVFECEFHH
ncbi:MAG: HDOD domain-containing protein [Acidimicrobiia bacterium]|nr:HDOD domain-containing protein [Acidimicrobiia bacterium]